MKILIVLTPPFDPNAGGVQMSTFKMAHYFDSQGMKVGIYSFKNLGHVKQKFANLFVAPLPGGLKEKFNLNHFESNLKSFLPNIVINQMPYEHSIGESLLFFKRKHSFLLLACLRNTLFSVKLNLDTYVKNVIPFGIHRLFMNQLGKRILLLQHKHKHSKDLKRILDTYDYFVMFGPPNRIELEYFVGKYQSHKTAFIPNSIPSVEVEVPTKEKRILWLSRLSYAQKRAELIIPLWKKILHKLPDWQLDIVGNGDAYNDIKEQIEREQIPRVNLYGKQDPNSYYRRSPIYIMTSAFEGFPNTVIEAQSFGAIPVIFDNYPIASSVVNHELDGYLIDAFDLDQMAKSLVHIAKNETLIKTMGQSALINASKFTIDKVGTLWLKIFDIYKF